jgi:hypothetical protein
MFFFFSLTRDSLFSRVGANAAGSHFHGNDEALKVLGVLCPNMTSIDHLHYRKIGKARHIGANARKKERQKNKMNKDKERMDSAFARDGE